MSEEENLLTFEYDLVRPGTSQLRVISQVKSAPRMTLRRVQTMEILNCLTTKLYMLPLCHQDSRSAFLGVLIYVFVLNLLLLMSQRTVLIDNFLFQMMNDAVF